MKKTLITILIILTAVAAAGCTTPPAENIHLTRTTTTTTMTTTITEPYPTTATITREQTLITTQTHIKLTTTTITLRTTTTITITTTISTGGATTTTKTITVYVNTLGDGEPNAVSLYIYQPTQKITYTLPDGITLTYTPYTQLNPMTTIYSEHQSIIIIPHANTITAYWPAASGTDPILIKFIKGVLSWWDYLYVQKIYATLPENIYQYASEHYTYNTLRALSFNEFYLPHQLIQNGGGNDGDFAEFYAAMMYAHNQPATAAIVKYKNDNHHIVFISNGTIIDANTREFPNMQALANIYGINPTVTYLTIGTYTPIRNPHTATYTHQPIWFLNTIPATLSITAIEKMTVNGTETTIQLAGKITNGNVSILEIKYFPTSKEIITITGNTETLTTIILGAPTTTTLQRTTLFFAGGNVTLQPPIMQALLGEPFDNNIITNAIITNHTTIIDGYAITSGTTTIIHRQKILSTEYYTLKIIGPYGQTLTTATGTIFYQTP